MLQGSRSCLNPNKNIDFFFCSSRQLTQLGSGHKLQAAPGLSASNSPGVKAVSSGPHRGRVCVAGRGLPRCSVLCMLLRARLTAGLEHRSPRTSPRRCFPKHPSFHLLVLPASLGLPFSVIWPESRGYRSPHCHTLPMTGPVPRAERHEEGREKQQGFAPP